VAIGGIGVAVGGTAVAVGGTLVGVDVCTALIGECVGIGLVLSGGAAEQTQINKTSRAQTDFLMIILLSTSIYSSQRYLSIYYYGIQNLPKPDQELPETVNLTSW
jgi:hypothetical protein